MEASISKGTDAILTVLGGQSVAVPEAQDGDMSNTSIIIILILVVIFCVRYPTLAWFIFSGLPNSSYRGGSGSGKFRAAFRAAAAAFGGGGSSGSW